MGDNPATREGAGASGRSGGVRSECLSSPARLCVGRRERKSGASGCHRGECLRLGAKPSLGGRWRLRVILSQSRRCADLNRSFQHDGFANTSLLLNHTIEKVGPFPFPVAVKE